MFSASGKKLAAPLYAKLQVVNTEMNTARNSGRPYKFNEEKIKDWRRRLRPYPKNQFDGWESFCAQFLKNRIELIWDNAVEELGINFLTLRSDDPPDWLTGEVSWENMASLVGRYGIGSFDAMIINLFLNSRFSALITADRDVAYTIERLNQAGKFAIVPDSLNV